MNWRKDYPVYLAGSAAATAVVSIFAAEVLLGAAFVAVLISGRKLRFPPLTLPLAAFVLWTIVSLAVSGHAAAGLPQIKKFYWLLMLITVSSALSEIRHIRAVVFAWAAGATLSSIWGFAQFVKLYRATPEYFYFAYTNGTRITGFTDNWMTLGALLMLSLLMFGSMFLLAPPVRAGDNPGTSGKLSLGLTAGAGLGAIPVMGTALLLAWVRSMWAGTAIGMLWLLWWRKKWLVLTVPIAAGVALLIPAIRERALSAIKPQFNTLDSRAHRAALRRVGYEMIKAHPLTGVGPEQVGPQFANYEPADLPHPFPVAWYKEHLHNIYLQYAAERGLPALAAILWFFARALYDFWTALRKGAPEARWILHGAIASVLAILISGWTEYNIGHGQVLGMFMAVLGCGYVAANVIGAAPERSTSNPNSR